MQIKKVDKKTSKWVKIAVSVLVNGKEIDDETLTLLTELEDTIYNLRTSGGLQEWIKNERRKNVSRDNK